MPDPCHYDPPLPPVPDEGEDLRDFVLRHRPEDVARLAAELDASPYSVGDAMQFSQIVGEIAWERPVYALAYADALLEYGTPATHADIMRLAHALLGRGFSRFEAIVWDILLFSQDAVTLDITFNNLEHYMSDPEEKGLLAGRYTEVYSWPQRLLHKIKLARAERAALG